MSYSSTSTVPIEMLPGIGRRTAKVLRSMHIRTVGQFKTLPEKMLVEIFGPSIRTLYTAVHGMEYASVATRPNVQPNVRTVKAIKNLSFTKKFRLATQVLMM